MGHVLPNMLESWWWLQLLQWLVQSIGIFTGIVVFTDAGAVGAFVLGLATMYSSDVDDVTMIGWLYNHM